MPSLQLVGALPKRVFQAMTCRAVLTRVMFGEQLGVLRGCAMTASLPRPGGFLLELRSDLCSPLFQGMQVV